MSYQPRVTLGIATYRRHDYLAEAIDSCLKQTYDDLEVLVVVDGPGTPEIDAILDARADNPQLRVVRHPENRGIAEAYNTFIDEGRGELIAMLGDDDVSMPDRIARQVAVFDEHPDTIVVHGNAMVIDANGVQRGANPTGDMPPAELLRHLVRVHNTLIDPSRMVHRRAYDLAGRYRAEYTLAQDFDFWLRAMLVGRFRHVGGAPLIKLRRHDDNFSHESQRAIEVEQVEMALTDLLSRAPLQQLVPELDWPVIDPRAGERRAFEILADAFEKRGLPLPRLAARMRELAAAVAEPDPPRRDRGKLLMTSYGFNDSGGGTTIPRVAAKELVRRGWDVTVFHAATGTLPDAGPYAVRQWEEDGVRLVGVFNRPHGLWDLQNPRRELDDPAITAAFAATVDTFQPDVAHVHNLHNMGAELLDVLGSRGVRTYFTTHNYWLVCPRAYLFQSDLTLCDGPAGGDACATCIGHDDVTGYQARLDGIRDRFSRNVEACMTVSHAVRRVLLGQGYDPGQLDVVRQCVPAQDEAWQRVGRDRVPGRVDGKALIVGFFGSVYGHKGAHLLVQAAQQTEHEVRIQIHGEMPIQTFRQLQALDKRRVVELCGPFSPSGLPDLLAGVDAAALPSVWWDCAPLTAGECLAARVPVLAPRMGGLAECIEDGVDGLAFDGGDIDGLAAAMDRLASEAGLLETLQSQIQAPRGFGNWVDELERYYAGERPGRVLGAGPTRTAVRWVGDQDRSTSLARINREVCAQLEADQNFAVERCSLDGGRLQVPLPHPADVEVRHQWPPNLARTAAGRLALIQPWEWGSIPKAWLEPLKSMVDELWVPSEFVRSMYVEGGVDPAKVKVVPNGVDLDQFTPEGPSHPVEGIPAGALCFLFVGGVIQRKGPDVLLAAWRKAFAGRTDVALIIKDFGADGIYRSGDRTPIADAIADPQTAPIVHLNADLSDAEVAALYRSADVLVHPYRGEGFAMPVLEAMASGLPTIVTGGGPTDEFCPPEAGWRIASERVDRGITTIDTLEMTASVWDLEPSIDDLAALLVHVASDRDEIARRGAAARAAAQPYSWQAVGEQYAERIRDLARRAPLATATPSAEELELEPDGPAPQILAVPAWRGDDRLGELLLAWQHSGSSGTLVLLADPAVDGTGEELEARATQAAADAGADLSACPDIAIRYETPYPGRDAALIAQCDGYVPLHDGAPGFARLARAAQLPVLTPDLDGLRLITTRDQRTDTATTTTGLAA